MTRKGEGTHTTIKSASVDDDLLAYLFKIDESLTEWIRRHWTAEQEDQESFLRKQQEVIDRQIKDLQTRKEEVETKIKAFKQLRIEDSKDMFLERVKNEYVKANRGRDPVADIEWIEGRFSNELFHLDMRGRQVLKQVMKRMEKDKVVVLER